MKEFTTVARQIDSKVTRSLESVKNTNSQNGKHRLKYFINVIVIAFSEYFALGYIFDI